MTPHLVELPVLRDTRGALTVIEQGIVPFPVQRVYYIYDVPFGSCRAGHAHRKLEQLLVALCGSFDVTLTDGIWTETFNLHRNCYGLYIPPLYWRRIDNFSSGAVCLAAVSAPYEASDYIRDYSEFTRLRGC